VELILALGVRPRVLLLDEPTAGLSPAETATVAAIIRRFPRDLTLLFIEHDMDVALDLADRVVVLHQGRVLAEGSPEEIRRDSRVAETYLGASHA
jgi:branched-chain amino acid transport system ATP-binding protein